MSRESKLLYERDIEKANSRIGRLRHALRNIANGAEDSSLERTALDALADDERQP